MVKQCGFNSLDEMIKATVPKSIQRTDGMPLGELYHQGMTESEFLAFFKWVDREVSPLPPMCKVRGALLT